MFDLEASTDFYRLEGPQKSVNGVYKKKNDNFHKP